VGSGLQSLESLQLDRSTVTRLNLHGNQLPSLACPSGSFSAVVELNVSANRLTTLRGVENFPSLVTLDVSANQISTLSDLVAHSSQVQSLSLAHNKLTHLNGLEVFRRVEVSGVHLSHFPLHHLHHPHPCSHLPPFIPRRTRSLSTFVAIDYLLLMC